MRFLLANGFLPAYDCKNTNKNQTGKKNFLSELFPWTLSELIAVATYYFSFFYVVKLYNKLDGTGSNL